MLNLVIPWYLIISLIFYTTENSTTGSYNQSGTPSGKLGGYYSCESKIDLKFMTNTKDYSVKAGFQDMKVEPFVAKNSTGDFGGGEYDDDDHDDCPSPTSPAPPFLFLS